MVGLRGGYRSTRESRRTLDDLELGLDGDLCDPSRSLLHDAQRARELVLELARLLALLVEDEAAEQGGALLRREVVEDAVEDHLGEQQLVAGADLARDADRKSVV